MQMGSMVDDEVENDTEATQMVSCNEPFHVGDCAVGWVDRFVVGDVVIHVVLRAIVHGTDPYHIDAEGVDVIGLGDDAGNVIDTIAV